MCEHKQAYKTYDEPDGQLYHCPTCGATLDEDYEVIRIVKEIPYERDDL